VQTYSALHIIKHGLLSPNFVRIVPFNRSSIFTKRCTEALLTCFLCAVTVFCLNVQQYFQVGNGVRWYFVPYDTKLIFIDPCVKTTGFFAGSSFASHSFNIMDLSTRQCPRLTVHAKRFTVHCCRPRIRTSSDRTTGDQTARI